MANVHRVIADLDEYAVHGKLYHQLRYLLAMSIAGGKIGRNAIMRLTGISLRKAVEGAERRKLLNAIVDNARNYKEYDEEFRHLDNDEDDEEEEEVDVTGEYGDSLTSFMQGAKRKINVNRVDLSVIRLYIDATDDNILRTDTFARPR